MYSIHVQVHHSDACAGVHTCTCTCIFTHIVHIPAPDFSTLEAWDKERLEEYIPTITYEAESPDEAALVEVRIIVKYTTCLCAFHVIYNVHNCDVSIHHKLI